ncbi:hypothetical protein PAXINDRAFT_174292 [Paxillus involutus ATCC 200175]|nr:hypothetical protein PAXINDRAFT_174292 [Paxillus involutus ATCC 200175]
MDNSPDMVAQAKRVLSRTMHYDSQIKDLDSSLREHLGNFRAIEISIKDALAELNRNTQRADQALSVDIPKLKDELQGSLVILQDLSTTLPRIRLRVANIRRAYNSGRTKAQELVSDLTWLNNDFHERWKLIIFTSSAPVSWRWKAAMRIWFAILLVTFMWVAWVAISGAYRAHRQGLLWGERLMS